MGAQCSAAIGLENCLPLLASLRQALAAPDAEVSSADACPSTVQSLTEKRTGKHGIGAPKPRSSSERYCGSCSCESEELAKSNRGVLLCRTCVRMEDQSRLEPLTEEERTGLDLVSEVLDSVSWNHWKPGEQPATILDWLCLGDLHEATNLELLERRKIKAVLNLIGWWELAALLPEGTNLLHVFSTRGVEYEEADSEDRLFFDIIEESWPKSERFLRSCRAEGRRVLVNCHAGHNRSACMVVSWLMVHEGFSLLDSLERVQTLRGTILSNHGFRLQLVRLALKMNRLGILPAAAVSRRQGGNHNLFAIKEHRRMSFGDMSPKLDQIISTKRLIVKYDHNAKDEVTKYYMTTPPQKRSRNSLISEEMSGLVSQRKLSMELLACLLHLKKNFLEDYAYTADPPVVIGTGFSGDVLLCHRRGGTDAIDLGGLPKNSLRCVKRFLHQKMAPQHVEKLKNEAIIYLSLEHPHIARLFDVYEDDQELSLVMQYCSGGTLQDVLLDRGHFTEVQFKESALQMLRTMNYVHQAGIVHRDIKPRNWVYEAERSVLKLIDFGFSAKSIILTPEASSSLAKGHNQQSLRGCMGTLGYLAPEVIRCSLASDQSYDEKCDIWSLGVVFLELLTGEPVFERPPGTCDGYTEEIVLREIQEVSPEDIDRLVARIPEGAANFVRRMLTREPSDRPSAKELLQDPYLADARQKLGQPVDALPVKDVVARFCAYAELSAPTRASMLAMARAPTRLPWREFCALRATFDVFDAQELNGTVGLDAFTSVILAGSRPDVREAGRADVHLLWQQVCGREEALSYCEFLAALLAPASVEDAFQDVSDTPAALPAELPKHSETSNTPGLPGQVSGVGVWDLSLPVSYYLRRLTSISSPVANMIFDERRTLREVVQVMTEKHFRWVIVRYRSGRDEFFDYMDICHMITKLAVSNSGSLLKAAVAQLCNMAVGALANCSGYSAFVSLKDDAPFGTLLEFLVKGHRDKRPGARAPANRVPILSPGGELVHVFSCLNFLDLALQFDKPSAVLKSRDARTFDRRDAVVALGVPHDESLLNALRLMDSEGLTICPATSMELSGSLGGLIAVGVVSVTDLKWVIESDDFSTLERSVEDFLSWRNGVSNQKSEHVDRNQKLKRFNVVSVDKNESLHDVATRLVASKLQRIFLSSSEIARIVGIVSSRDILVEVIDQLLHSSQLSRGLVPAGSDEPQDRKNSW